MFECLFDKKIFAQKTSTNIYHILLHYLNRIFNFRVIVSLFFLSVIGFIWMKFRDEKINFGQYSYVFNREIILEFRSSDFHNITIAQSGSLRMLRFNRSDFEGVIHLEKPYVILFDYMRLQLLALLWNSQPERILIIGLGTGTLPKIFHYLSPKTFIDIVEIDSVIVDIARKYFHFQETNVMKIYIEDGRYFLERQRSNQYDLIFIDAFTVNHRIPHTLRTLECLGEYLRLLKSTGLVLSNCIYEHENRYRQTYARALFQHIYLALAVNNYILIGLNKGAQLFNQTLLKNQAQILQKRVPLPEMNWMNEIKYLRDGNDEQWNRSATIFTDKIHENI